MAGLRFLNPLLKVVLCLLGMGVMGFFLYESISSGTSDDRMTIVRALVFLGFAYLFVKAAADLVRQRKDNE
ncbi:MAG: hypothetical protein HY912_20895 [Desulfomonile tiedjei]|uniref:Uncharacterized protein n=1 Tax=Desulfomonile tiedjei TaxID=2358 RepID=A0A9D6V759_9BACT|nr:hypothetical protein [Desulfomonile tiedjei]